MLAAVFDVGGIEWRQVEQFLAHYVVDLPVVILLFAVGEWLMHRYVLHNKWIYDHIPPFRYIYRNHAIDHHGKKQNKLRPHIYLVPLDYLIVYFFIFLNFYRGFGLGEIQGFSRAAALITVMFTHNFLWNALHETFHDLDITEDTGPSLIRKIPFYGKLRAHHLNHHVDPKTNFGIVFTFVDWCFGTDRNSKVGKE